MKWGDLKPGDVILPRWLGDMGAFVVLRTDPDNMSLTTLSLTDAREETHICGKHNNLPNTCTVLRESNVEQQGDV